MVTALAATLLAFVPATKAEAAPVLLSQGKPVTASSEENYGTPATAAVDGNANTRWSSAASDPQWIRVDL
ncbi:discoidin domain-containing protein, partial [Streptomyces halstedii]